MEKRRSRHDQMIEILIYLKNEGMPALPTKIRDNINLQWYSMEKELDYLIKIGYVEESDIGISRKVYEITPEGLAALAGSAEEMYKKLKAEPTSSNSST